MGFLKSTKGSLISDYFKLENTVPGFDTGMMVDVALYEDHLELKECGKKMEPVTLNYSQITDIFYGLQTEIVEKNKSAIGRAVAGGLLFGGLGAVVGAVSGTGKKEKKETKVMFIISYTSGSGEESFLTFEDTRMYKGNKLSKKLKDICNITAPKSL